MKPGMKMLMATRTREEGGNGGNERRGAQNNYGESRYDGARNIGEMNDSRSYPQNNEMNYPRYEGRMEYPRGEMERSGDRRTGRGTRMDYDDMDSRFRDRRGREHYDNGRFAPMRNDGEMNSHYEPYSPYVPPVYQNEGNQIGFSIDGRMDKVVPIESRMHRDELTKEKAEEWTAAMQNEDGTRGPHWSMEQVKQAMAQKGIKADLIQFYLALNMMYSDYCAVAKKMNVNNIDFYIGMAKAFLDDKDAGEDKLMRYYKYVVM